MQTYQITVANMFDHSGLTDTVIVTAKDKWSAIQIACNADILPYADNNYPTKITRIS